MRKILSILIFLALYSICNAQQNQTKTWWERLKENTFESESATVDNIPQKTDVQEDTLSFAVMLPFNSANTPDNISYSLYSGILCAMKEYSDQSFPIKLNVFDTSEGIDPDVFLSNDILLGPISRKDIKEISSLVPYGKFIISPLEPSVTGLTDSLQIIQAPLPWSGQIQQLTRWACDDLTPGDSLLIVKEKNVTSEVYSAIRKSISESGTPCLILNLESSEDIPSILSRYSSQRGTTRIIIASEDEAFTKRLLEVLNILNIENHQIATYLPSKIRNYSSITKTMLCNANARTTVGYYYDANSFNAKQFTNLYKQYFKVKPSQFAYQGYDLAKYFVSIYQLYGKSWVEHLEEFDMRGIQTTLDFSRPSGIGGYVNKSARSIVYSNNEVHLIVR